MRRLGTIQIRGQRAPTVVTGALRELLLRKSEVSMRMILKTVSISLLTCCETKIMIEMEDIDYA